MTATGAGPGRPFSLDAYTPEQIAEQVQRGGPAKVRLDALTTLTVGVLAGAFVGLGAAFATAVMTDSTLGYGPTRLLGGLAFGTGLVLALIGGAQLFTSNSLIVMAWASRLVTSKELFRNWVLVWIGNFVGAVATAVLVFLTGHADLGDHAMGATALATADLKLSRNIPEAVSVGIVGNGLVCLAVWASYSARSTTDRILASLPPVAALVALNVDHCVGNMYYLTMGILVDDDPRVLEAAARTAADVAHVDVGPALGNLAAVTVGNIIGGGLLVAAVYWFVYLRPPRP